MDAAQPATKKCPFCAETILFDAIKCKHCGERLDTAYAQKPSLAKPINRQALPERKWSPGIAAVLSFFIPGLGQMYKGNIMSGILWMIFTAIGYFLLIIPGAILHLICIFAAASGDPYR